MYQYDQNEERSEAKERFYAISFQLFFRIPRLRKVEQIRRSSSYNGHASFLFTLPMIMYCANTYIL